MRRVLELLGQWLREVEEKKKGKVERKNAKASFKNNRQREKSSSNI